MGVKRKENESLEEPDFKKYMQTHTHTPPPPPLCDWKWEVHNRLQCMKEPSLISAQSTNGKGCSEWPVQSKNALVRIQRTACEIKHWNLIPRWWYWDKDVGRRLTRIEPLWTNSFHKENFINQISSFHKEERNKGRGSKIEKRDEKEEGEETPENSLTLQAIWEHNQTINYLWTKNWAIRRLHPDWHSVLRLPAFGSERNKSHCL